MHGLGQSKKPFKFISIDLYIQYIGCFFQFLYEEILGQPKHY
jgi:hypothetical protein